MTNSSASFDQIMTAISDYALALRSDSTASDSTLDDLQFELDRILNADDAMIDDDDRLTIDRESFDAASFAHLDPDLSRRTIDAQIDDLARISNLLFDLRP